MCSCEQQQCDCDISQQQCDCDISQQQCHCDISQQQCDCDISQQQCHCDISQQSIQTHFSLSNTSLKISQKMAETCSSIATCMCIIVSKYSADVGTIAVSQRAFQQPDKPTGSSSVRTDTCNRTTILERNRVEPDLMTSAITLMTFVMMMTMAMMIYVTLTSCHEWVIEWVTSLLPLQLLLRGCRSCERERLLAAKRFCKWERLCSLWGIGWGWRNRFVTGRDCVLCEVLAEAEETIEHSTENKKPQPYNSLLLFAQLIS